MSCSNVEHIKQFIQERVGETKCIGVWCDELNQTLPRNKKVSIRKLAFIFNRKLKNNEFTVHYSRDPNHYTFYL